MNSTARKPWLFYLSLKISFCIIGFFHADCNSYSICSRGDQYLFFPSLLPTCFCPYPWKATDAAIIHFPFACVCSPVVLADDQLSAAVHALVNNPCACARTFRFKFSRVMNKGLLAEGSPIHRLIDV